MNPKAKSMLAHITPLGWLVAFVLNARESDQLTGFYLAQTLGLFICFFLTRFIPDYFIFAWAFLFVLWVYSFVGALKGDENLIPFLGSYFQQWFRKISK